MSDQVNLNDFSMRVSLKFDQYSLSIAKELSEKNIFDNDLLNKCTNEWVKILLKNNIEKVNNDEVLEYKYRGKDQGFLHNMKHNIQLKPLKFYHDSNLDMYFFSSPFELKYKGVKELQGMHGKLKGELIIQLVSKE